MKAPKPQTSVNPEILTSRRRCRTRVRGPSRGCGGGFAEQVTGNVEKGKAPTFIWKRLEIRLDENLNGLIAGVNLDSNRRAPKSTSWRRPFSPRIMAWGIIVSF